MHSSVKEQITLLKAEIEKKKRLNEEAAMDAAIIEAYRAGRWCGSIDPNFNWSDLTIH